MFKYCIRLFICAIVVFLPLCSFSASAIAIRAENDSTHYLRSAIEKETYRNAVDIWLAKVNVVLGKIANKRAELMWQLETNITKEAENQLIQFQDSHLKVNRIICNQHSKINIRLLNYSQRRMMRNFCNGIVFSQSDAKELIDVKTRLQIIYSEASVVLNGHTYRGESEVQLLMANVTSDLSVLLKIWLDWREAIGTRAKNLYTRLIELQNKGAEMAGYNDISQVWKEELEVENLENVIEGLYSEIKPLYSQLYAFVRGRLAEYHPGSIKPDKPLPAHVFGNMWAQNWESLLPILLGNTSNANECVQSRAVPKEWSTVQDMAHVSEDFFKSMGFPALPTTFWTKSQFVQPADGRKVVCHASASDFFKHNDVRLLMCGKLTEEDFYTIHHEMGHLYYFLTYSKQPFLFRVGANSAFHEAIGDTITYGAMTTKHRKRIGLSQNTEKNGNRDIVRLLRLALMKIPIFPYSIALEKWRWGVMSGGIKPSAYNKAWWNLKLKYMGIVPPVPRSEKNFDPAAKFHVSTNVPYIRYFLSGIFQVQFFDALCEAIQQGPRFGMPLSECDIYGSKIAGDVLRSMMALGGSKPWDYALKTLTKGKTNALSAKPLLDYYKPLYDWLVQENHHSNYRTL